MEDREFVDEGSVVGSASAIVLDGVTKDFELRRGDVLCAVNDVSLEVASGEFLSFIGPSGCGKSTLLRLVASLETPTRGRVEVNGHLPAELASAHRLGVAFQDHALLPWLTLGTISPFRIGWLGSNLTGTVLLS